MQARNIEGEGAATARTTAGPGAITPRTGSQPRVKVVLIDDHKLVRAGMRMLLEGSGGCEIVGEAEDATEAYAAVESAKPQVVVCDVSLQGVQGHSIVREIHRRNPEVRILMLSMHLTQEHVAQALDAGAIGYACKTESPTELCEAVVRTAQGHPYLSPGLSRFVLDEYLRQRRGGAARQGPLDVLSTREREVFGLIVKGMRNAEIATNLCISRRTVESHRGKIQQKLNLASLAEVFLFAARHQLLE